ncbi:CGNR zinc finger domain-containing protein [Paenibacillus harenae]|uniref:CGNR zinc finger domain-containing protein n=1 Tax=Paenibacillus harenae TaxID=306543 RepID=UPI00278CD480|nr:CGNR zinc finger domain-containing protein [Paenibacillus harenae]MDQ0061608.1 putative RNA-binding Zn ribbon-like protein [Paenibacillus harenae]
MPKKIAPSFLFIGNHPVLDFINTKIAVDGKPVDLLETFPDALDWLYKAGFLNEKERVQFEQSWGNSDQGSQALEAARELRSALLTIIEICKSGENISVRQDYLETINDLLYDQVITTKLIYTDNGFVIKKRVKSQTPTDLLAPIAQSAMDLFSRNTFSLIKKCGNPECVLYFYDNSKNSTRRWCSQKTCGNRMKVMAYLERQRNQ